MIAALLLLSTLARAADVPPDETPPGDDPLAPEVTTSGPRALIHVGRPDGKPRVRLPPTRLEVRFPIRQDLALFPYFGFGTQLARRGRFTLDADVGITGGRGIRMPGPWRIQAAATGALTALWEVGPWLAVGPTGGIDYRWWRQQGVPIASGWMPVVGLRTNSMLIGARRWGFVLGAGVTADLGRTRFVRENAEIVDLVPFEGFVSTRFVFGHGRDPRREAE